MLSLFVHSLSGDHKLCEESSTTKEEKPESKGHQMENELVKKVIEQLKPPKDEIDGIFAENISLRQYDRQRLNTFYMSKMES